MLGAPLGKSEGVVLGDTLGAELGSRVLANPVGLSLGGTVGEGPG
jgi:hypothetical protein